MPVRITLFDQFGLPGAPPPLDALLPQNGFGNVIMRFEPDECLASILSGKSGIDIMPVLPDPRLEVGRDARIEGAVLLGGEDIDEGIYHAQNIS